ncbi:hypothetical protein MALU111345_18750 [Marinicrinis lubricantis]
MPLELLGKSIFWWFHKTGVLKASPQSMLGLKLQKRGDPIFGYTPKQLIKSGQIKLKPRTILLDSSGAHFSDGTSIRVGNLILATGFAADYRIIEISGALDKSGRPIHHQGMSLVQGLFYLGMPWMRSRASALIGGIGEDAAFLAQHW